MNGKRLALIVATDKYQDPGLRRLRAPAKDAEALARVLADPELGEFEVDVLRNETSWAIGERVETLLTGAKPNDLIVLHFSCHGLKDDSGELFLAATNTRPELLSSTAVDASIVNRLMRRSRAQRAVLFLDCCFGGAFERGVVPRAAGVIDVADQFRQREDELAGGRGRVVITASNAMEFAFEGSDLADGIATEPSVFTGALVEGLATGAADRDQDGMVSLGELYDYVFDRVRQTTPNQTPGKWEFGLQGELMLAKNPQRVVVPAPLPPDLLELIEHPFPATRLGTIDVLLRLSEGTNLPVAAGARGVLQRMANDDSRAVAQAASNAVDRTSVRLSTVSIDFGAVRVGADVTAEVSLEGAPLAFASRIESSTPAVRARRIDRAIRLEADTSVAGHIDGIVRVSGPAGNAEVHVVGVVIGGPVKGRQKVVPHAPQEPPIVASVAKPETTPAAPQVMQVTPPLASSSALGTRPVSSSQGPSETPTERLWQRLGRSARRLIERGWRMGHIQTLIGAELGAIGVWSVRPDSLLGSIFQTDESRHEGTFGVIWLAAVVGASLVLRLAGPTGWWKTVLALVLMYPLFRGFAFDIALYLTPTNLIGIAILTAVIALIASSVVRLKRPTSA
jgi:hypothetical protein